MTLGDFASLQPRIATYPAGADKNVPPSRIIEGQKTLLNRTVLSKFGFRAAEISIAFRRRK